MKTNLVKIAKVLVLASMTMLLANCSKDSGGSSSTNTGYVWSANGQCVNPTTGQYTSDTALCNNSGSNICNGTYYYGSQYGTQSIQCSSTSTVYYNANVQTGYNQVFNCRGLYLYQLINTNGQQQWSRQISCQ